MVGSRHKMCAPVTFNEWLGEFTDYMKNVKEVENFQCIM